MFYYFAVSFLSIPNNYSIVQKKSQLNESYLILVFMVILILEQQMIEAYIIGILKPAQ